MWKAQHIVMKLVVLFRPILALTAPDAGLPQVSAAAGAGGEQPPMTMEEAIAALRAEAAQASGIESQEAAKEMVRPPLPPLPTGDGEDDWPDLQGGLGPPASAIPKPNTGGKLLVAVPRKSEIFVMNLDGSGAQPFVESGAFCPKMPKGAMTEATAMMGRPEWMAVDDLGNRMFWSDWLGGTGSGNASYNASILSSTLDKGLIDPVVTSAYLRPPPDKPNGRPGCDGYSTWDCPPAAFHKDRPRKWRPRPRGKVPITHLDSPHGLAVDPVEKMLYFSDRAHTKGSQGVGPKKPTFQRVSYDGFSKPPSHFPVDVIGEILGMAVDHRPSQRRIYWIEYVNMKKDPKTGQQLIGSQIKRAKLNGKNVEVLASWLARAPIGLALDFKNDYFYWTEYVGGRIQRCPMAGCKKRKFVGVQPELVLATFKGGYSSTTPKLGGIAIHPELGMMYWAENHFDKPPPGETKMIHGGIVKSAKLDGTGVKEVYRVVNPNSLYKSAPLGVALVVNAPKTISTTTTSAGFRRRRQSVDKGTAGKGRRRYVKTITTTTTKSSRGGRRRTGVGGGKGRRRYVKTTTTTTTKSARGGRRRTGVGDLSVGGGKGRRRYVKTTTTTTTKSGGGGKRRRRYVKTTTRRRRYVKGTTKTTKGTKTTTKSRRRRPVS